MRILAVDTCAKSCSVAVSDAGRVLAEIATRRRQTHSRHLMRMVDMALELSGVAMEDVDAFGVTRGPGSFTGLRIGISTVKGMAMAAARPMVGVSSLQALAWPMSCCGDLVCALLDAGKGEVYTASYRFQGGRPDAASWGAAAAGAPDGFMKERVVPPEVLVASISERCVLVGDGVRTYGETITAHLGSLACMPPDEFHDVRASSVARIAMMRLEDGPADGIGDLTPQYLRKSDAELRLGMPKKCSP